MLTIIALIALGAIAVILVLAAMKPNTFRVQRHAVIKAAPDTLFAALSDFHKWGAWSPWEKLDPTMERTFSGAAACKGAVYAWNGNKAGAGSMEITEANPPARLVIALNFTRPFKANNVVDFALEPEGDSTKVTWAMQGAVPFIGKVMHVFMNMDKMIGKDYEAGLANLKALTEKPQA